MLIGKSQNYEGKNADKKVWHCMTEYLTLENYNIIKASLVELIQHAKMLKETASSAAAVALESNAAAVAEEVVIVQENQAAH